MALLVLAAVTAALWPRKPEVTLTYGGVTLGPIAREVLTGGTLEPAHEVEAGAQVSGTVQSLHADFNSKVKTGQVIAELDPSVYDAELAQARARLIQAEADVEQRKVVADDTAVKAGRARELRASDLIAQSELDSAELAARQAQADLRSAVAASKAARAMLAQAEVNRSRTTIRSPIDGIVVSRNVEIGQTLAARLEAPILFRIADLRKMQMLTEVSEAEVGGVRPGTEVTFEIESLGPQQFKGTVSEVRLQPVHQGGATATAGTSAAGTAATAATSGTPAAAQSTVGATAAQGAASSQTAPQAASGTAPAPAGSVVSYTAIVEVNNADDRIAPGSTAIVKLPTTRRSDVLRVPNNALAFRPPPAVLKSTGQSALTVPAIDPSADDPAKGRAGYVWKFERGKFVPLEVRAGASDESWTEILSGPIQPGDQLVTAATTGR